MNVHGWLTLVACAGQLALAALAFFRVSRSPLALPLGLLCLNQFSWNLAFLAYSVSGDVRWRYLDVALSPFTAPLAFHFVVTFIGRRRELGRVLGLAYVAFGALAAPGALALVWDEAAKFAGSSAWALAFLAIVVVTIGYAVALLLQHLRKTADTEEGMPTRLVLAALAVGAVLASTELLADLGIPVPRGGNLGSLAGAGVLAIVALRFRLFEEDLSKSSAAYALALGALAVVGYLSVFYLLMASTAMLVLGTITITFALLFATRQAVLAAAAHRREVERLALLGRFSAQMAHDLKNPLAAMKGAVQYLKEERARGKPAEDSTEFLDLIADQVERLQTVIEQYQRIGRAEPMVSQIDLNELVRSVVAGQSLAAGVGIKVRAELAETLPPCPADRDLLAQMVENILRNAFEAMPEGGLVTVRTRLVENGSGARVALTVQDSGVGMEARVAERAFDEFFTTKARGSGLGLAFVKRVARAHGGEVTLTSRLGRGTAVQVSLPATS